MNDMINLVDELALAGKPLIDLVKDVAKEAVVLAALKVIGMGEGGEPQQARPEQMPIRIEVVMAAQKGADTAIALQQGAQAPLGIEKKRFPARTFVVPIAVQNRKAMPVMMK